jgi:hypothetical protein
VAKDKKKKPKMGGDDSINRLADDGIAIQILLIGVSISLAF